MKIVQITSTYTPWVKEVRYCCQEASDARYIMKFDLNKQAAYGRLEIPPLGKCSFCPFCGEKVVFEEAE